MIWEVCDTGLRRHKENEVPWRPRANIMLSCFFRIHFPNLTFQSPYDAMHLNAMHLDAMQKQIRSSASSQHVLKEPSGFKNGPSAP